MTYKLFVDLERTELEGGYKPAKATYRAIKAYIRITYKGANLPKDSIAKIAREVYDPFGDLHYKKYPDEDPWSRCEALLHKRAEEEYYYVLRKYGYPEEHAYKKCKTLNKGKDTADSGPSGSKGSLHAAEMREREARADHLANIRIHVRRPRGYPHRSESDLAEELEPKDPSGLSRGASTGNTYNTRVVTPSDDSNTSTRTHSVPSGTPQQPSRASYHTVERKPLGASHGYATRHNRPSNYFPQPRSKSSSSTSHNSAPPPKTGKKPPLPLYTVLGVSSKASADEIHKAYKKLSMKHHPDRVHGEEEKKMATEKMQELSQAKDVLLNKKKREWYDEKGRVPGSFDVQDT